MRRRDFLAATAAVAGSSLARSAGAQWDNYPPRAAVVIGVDRPQSLPPLKAAATDAKRVGNWLNSEHFDVNLLVDAEKPVSAQDVYNAVENFVQKGTIQQLVVYFSGHGVLLRGSEYWLLSKAPGNPNEVINLASSTELARDCGIPNVVFISDACRSTSDSLRIQSVGDYRIFPASSSVRSPRAEIDRFFATLPGDPAQEIPVDSAAKYEGIYTGCFLDAFANPDSDMVARSADGGRVIPNRRLKPYLLREVRKRIEAKSLNRRQDPDAIVESETAYLGRVPEQVVPNPPSQAQITPTLADVAMHELARAGVLPQSPTATSFTETAMNQVAAETGFTAARIAILKTELPAKIGPLSSGGPPPSIIVSGAEPEVVISAADVRTEIIRPTARSEPTGVRVARNDRPGNSVALRWRDGGGTVVAALREYIASVIVENGKVINVTYAPLFSLDPAMLRQLDELHAVVAAAARFGVFRIAGDGETRRRQVRQLADRIRVMKSVDPTLGLYAAYAYASVGLIEQVRSVQRFMRGDLGIDLFDVAMLAGKRDDFRSVAPFFPMLSQGWALIGAYDLTVPKQIEAARDHLRPALWATFEPKGMDILANALQSGMLR